MDRELTVFQPMWSPWSSTVLAGDQGSSEPLNLSLHKLFLEAAKSLDFGEARWCARLPILLTNSTLAYSVILVLLALSIFCV